MKDRLETRAAPLVIEALLKQDALGRVERVRCPHARWSLRSAAPGALGVAARLLLRRERRALSALHGLSGVPQVSAGCACPDALGARSALLLRTWIDGVPLPAAEALPADWFDELERLVRALHARGVCHNDLHKEPNLIAGADGWPWVVDFQLASLHRGEGRVFRARCADDLRHVEKHRRRYRLAGRSKDVLSPTERALPPRSTLAWAWRRGGKPLYNALTRGLLDWRDGEGRGVGELRRPESGPWPLTLPPRGPRPATGA
jgi:predicted Ser/Thr protein kinase